MGCLLVRPIARALTAANDHSAVCQSLEIPNSTKLPLLTGDYSFPLHAGLLATIVVAIIAAVVLSKTAFGVKLRAVGYNPVAASRAGISYWRMVIVSLQPRALSAVSPAGSCC